MLLGASPALPASFSAEHLEGPILDQNTCGSCGGHGTAQGLFVAFAFAGWPLPAMPSPLDIYRNTRATERAATCPDDYVGELASLTDSGIVPADVMLTLGSVGIREMTAPSPLGFDTDCDASNVNSEPPLLDLEADAKRIVTGEYRIDESAPDVIEQVRAAIVKCGAVGIAAFVDTGFENYTPATGPIDTVNFDDSRGGGHWIALTSYYTRTDGTIVFRGPNSWTAQWGDRGHFEVTEHWLRKAVSDIYPWAVNR